MSWTIDWHASPMIREGNIHRVTDRGRLLHVALILLVASSAWATEMRGAQTSSGLVRVAISTEAGEIRLDLDMERAPVSVLNFLHYVDEGLYENGSFYRAVRTDNQPSDSIRIQVVQGGMDRSRRDLAPAPIRLEGTRETGLRHLDGTISMARSGPDTGRAEFFICVGDQPELDEGGRRNPDGFGFAAFGRVTEGMDVVRTILAGPTEGQRLIRAVRILRIDRLSP